MKKLFMGFAACALILTSCNKNEVMENIDIGNEQLTFSPAIGKQTRAAEITNTTLETGATSGNPIMLYAFQDNGGSFTTWFNDELSYNGSAWEITTTRFRNAAPTQYLTYWPSGNIPIIDVRIDATNREFDYTVQSVATQEDLIAGITDVAENKTEIVFKMRHILSQVNFGVKSYKGARIDISKITVKGIYNKGTFTYALSDPGNTVGGGNIIGSWVSSSQQTTYMYSLPSITAVPTSLNDVESVATGDIYIFGDGGNAGPGTTDTFYPIGGTWTAPLLGTTGMDNSLMLLPQKLSRTGSEDVAEVEFEYTIQDVSGAYVAGPNATGTFSLDFTTGATSGEDYLGEWEQNFRYVYIIDFTDFLDDNKLTFTVDVQAFPWLNYNKDTDDDGEVDITVIGEPTESTINGLLRNDTYYMASTSTTAPRVDELSQVINNVTWDWSSYEFADISNSPEDSIRINFENVIFNNDTITLKVPEGFEIRYVNNTGNYQISGQSLEISSATILAPWVSISIVNRNAYRDAAVLKTVVEAATSNTELVFTGDASAIDLDSYVMSSGTPGKEITIKFTGKVPAVPLTRWVWDSGTNTATYTFS